MCRAVPAKVTVLPNGLDLAYVSRLDVRFLYTEIFENCVYLRHGLDICPGDTIVDVGANLGLFSIFSARRAGTKVFFIDDKEKLLVQSLI